MFKLTQWYLEGYEDSVVEETVGLYATEEEAQAAIDEELASITACEVLGAYGDEWGYEIEEVEG